MHAISNHSPAKTADMATTDLGAFTFDQEIVLIDQAPEDGTYTAIAWFNKRIISIEIEATTGNPVAIQPNTLNECYCYDFTLLSPSDELIGSFMVRVADKANMN